MQCSARGKKRRSLEADEKESNNRGERERERKSNEKRRWQTEIEGLICSCRLYSPPLFFFSPPSYSFHLEALSSYLRHSSLVFASLITPPFSAIVSLLFAHVHFSLLQPSERDPNAKQGSVLPNAIVNYITTQICAKPGKCKSSFLMSYFFWQEQVSFSHFVTVLPVLFPLPFSLSSLIFSSLSSGPDRYILLPSTSFSLFSSSFIRSSLLSFLISSGPDRDKLKRALSEHGYTHVDDDHVTLSDAARANEKLNIFSLLSKTLQAPNVNVGMLVPVMNCFVRKWENERKEKEVEK